MRVLLKLVFDCDPDAAWRALRSPSVFARVSSPSLVFESLEPGGFPEEWPEGEHAVRAKGLGVVPLGEQVIAIGYPAPRRGARLVRDSGHGRSGIFILVQKWEHTMAVAPAEGGRTLYRDRLEFDAGVLTPVLWPMYWAFWQIRALKMKRLARNW